MVFYEKVTSFEFLTLYFRFLSHLSFSSPLLLTDNIHTRFTSTGYIFHLKFQI